MAHNPNLVLTIKNSILRRASSGSGLVSRYQPIANKQAAGNGSAWTGADRIQHYFSKAKSVNRPDSVKNELIKYHNAPNGGIIMPKEVGIYDGRLWRFQFFKGGSDNQLVDAAFATEWWISSETFREIVAGSTNCREFLEDARRKLGLGFSLEFDTTRVIEAKVKYPIAAYSGRGAVTSENYDNEAFPTIYPASNLAQIFIPGMKDMINSPDSFVSTACFDIGATRLYDAVMAFNKIKGKQDSES